MGCVVRPAEQTPSPLLEFPSKAQLSEPPADKLSLKKDASNDLEAPIILFSATDVSGKPEAEHWSTELEAKNPTMEIISRWDDGSRYLAYVKFINATTEDITANVHLYAYDQMGRLVRAEVEANAYFRRGSIIIKQYTFTKRGREVRWIINMSGRK